MFPYPMDASMCHNNVWETADTTLAEGGLPARAAHAAAFSIQHMLTLSSHLSLAQPGQNLHSLLQ